MLTAVPIHAKTNQRVLCLSPRLSISGSASLYLCLHVSLSPRLSISVSASLYLCLPVSLSPHITISVSAYHYLCLQVSLSLRLSISVSASLYLCLCVSLSLSPRLSISVGWRKFIFSYMIDEASGLEALPQLNPILAFPLVLRGVLSCETI